MIRYIDLKRKKITWTRHVALVGENCRNVYNLGLIDVGTLKFAYPCIRKKVRHAALNPHMGVVVK